MQKVEDNGSHEYNEKLLPFLLESCHEDVVLCDLLKVNRLCRRICRLLLQGRRVGQIRKQHEVGIKQSNAPAEELSHVLQEQDMVVLPSFSWLRI
jgi:hypothetical protein